MSDQAPWFKALGRRALGELNLDCKHAVAELTRPPERQFSEQAAAARLVSLDRVNQRRGGPQERRDVGAHHPAVTLRRCG